MRASILIASRDRPGALVRCLYSAVRQNHGSSEILVLDDNSQSVRLADIVRERFPERRVAVFRSDQTLGVAGARNFLIGRSSGDVLVFLDDDAYLADSRCVSRLVCALSSDSRIGIVAVKVLDHQGGREDVLAPFARFHRRSCPEITERAQFVSYYVGTCHAIRRDVIEQCGPYEADLVFGEEELDLSYRAVEAGFRILYLPTVVAHHYPEPSVTETQIIGGGSELACHVRNRVFLAYKYLPWRYFFPHVGIWLARYFATGVAQGKVRDFWTGLLRALRKLRRTRRRPLSPRAVAYLRTHYGRLWY